MISNIETGIYFIENCFKNIPLVYSLNNPVNFLKSEILYFININIDWNIINQTGFTGLFHNNLFSDIKNISIMNSLIIFNQIPKLDSVQALEIEEEYNHVYIDIKSIFPDIRFIEYYRSYPSNIVLCLKKTEMTSIETIIYDYDFYDYEDMMIENHKLEMIDPANEK